MSAELLSSKVVLLEEEPKLRGIPSGATSVCGAVGLTERGPIDTPVLCTSFDDFTSNFGRFTVNSDLALAAYGFFENGGSQLWVVRTCHHTNIHDRSTATAAKASGVASPPGGSAVLRFEAIDAGAFGNTLEVRLRTASNGDADRFDLQVFEDGTFRELYTNLSADSAQPRFVVSALSAPRLASNFVRASVVDGTSGPAGVSATLSGGNDGLTNLDDSDFIGSDGAKTGLHALDTVQDLSLLIVPGRATPVIHHAMLNYCGTDRDGLVFAILDPPASMTAAAIVQYVADHAKLEGESEHGALYWPRVKVLNPQKSVFGPSEQVVAPPSGIIAGVFARTDAAKPGGVYDSPAGVEAGRMIGVFGFETEETREEKKRDLVFPHRVNPLTTGPGFPCFIDGARTLKADGNFPYVGERRGVSFIERSLRRGLQFARHRSNTESLRAQVRRTIAAFLLTQMNNGAFRSREPAKAFFVDVSDALNPPAVVFAGQLVVRVGLATNKPAEFVILRISQDTRAIEATLAAGA
jgi:phage tail sheath protein FI